MPGKPRPKRYTETINPMMTVEMKQDLIRASGRLDITASELIRRAIARYLEEVEA